MHDLTVIYYTNNREHPAFEQKIRKTLLDTITPLGLPLISVSQKPIDFGKNICVGDVGSSSQNGWRQFQVGAMEARTPFVCTAEADFIYPVSYFTYEHTRDDALLIAKPLYVLTAMRNKVCAYFPKRMGSFGASHAPRERIIESIEKTLRTAGKWGLHDESDFAFDDLFYYVGRAYFHLPQSIISIKTDNGMHRGSPHYRGVLRELPEWGSSHDMVRKYL